MNSPELPAVFLQMLNSFVTLGKTQNLSKTVELLGLSRQTIRRHIAELERRTNEKLFDTEYRQYRLTRRGKLLNIEAENLLSRANACLSNELTTPFDLLSMEIVVDEQSWLFAQQHPLLDIWSEGPPIIRAGFEAWTNCKGDLGDNAFKKIRPYMLVYRKYRGEWLIVEVGEKSAYGTWLGISNAKSELGSALDLGEKYNSLLSDWRKPYEAAANSGSAWYDHISVCVPRFLDGPPIPVNYQRLLVACKFPDGQPAIGIFSARTDNCQIPNMPEHMFTKNLPEYLMEFDI